MCKGKRKGKTANQKRGTNRTCNQTKLNEKLFPNQKIKSIYHKFNVLHNTTGEREREREKVNKKQYENLNESLEDEQSKTLTKTTFGRESVQHKNVAHTHTYEEQ